ncbi:hypothetical protein BGZ93_008564 [Podila epicladia]|nr:hypothetical protein BGZ93_008564 [Podila epicladia]
MERQAEDSPPYCKSSPGSYKFVLGSLLIYLLERTIREIRARKPTAISKIVLHPSKVVEVQVMKDHFRARAGQGSEAMTLPRVLLDGPYGSPSEDAFNYEIAVLVGAGIGVTPFASVLKHIWYRVMQPTKIITLRKVYFLWVCRDRDAFEWFQDLLIALEEQNLSDFLEIRSYLTGELGADELNTILMEARAAAAAAAARHLQRKQNSNSKVELESSGNTHFHQTDVHDALSESGLDRDAITGLRSPTYYGRPNFDKIFGELAQAHPPQQGQVGVFFCGPKPLGKTLHRCAKKYDFKFHKENF